jgi:hypothetical protein
MAKAMIDMSGGKPTAKEYESFDEKIKGKVFEFDILNSDLDLNGKFADGTFFQGDLWDRLKEKSGVKYAPKPKKTVSNIEEPGTYNVELEFWDRDFSCKIKIKTPTDKSSRVIKKNSHPPHVSVRNKGVNLADCPTKYANDLKELLKIMGKTASYEYVGGSGSHKGWSCDFGKHLHHEQPGEGWKVYIDVSASTGTKWRLYYTMDFDVPSQTLQIGLKKISEDH